MGEKECWNCGEPVQENWNYCIQCAYPITSDLVFLELIKVCQKKERILENATGLVAEGMENRYSETELRQIMDMVKEDQE